MRYIFVWYPPKVFKHKTLSYIIKMTEYMNFIDFIKEFDIPYCDNSTYLYENDNGDIQKNGKSLKSDKPRNTIKDKQTKSKWINVYLEHEDGNMFCLDIDDMNYNNDEIFAIVKEKLGFLPSYTLSCVKKKPHFYLNITDAPKDFTSKMDCLDFMKGDLIKKKHIVVENRDAELYVGDVDKDGSMIDIEWSTISKYLIEPKTTTKRPKAPKATKATKAPIDSTILNTLDTKLFSSYSAWIELLMTCKNLDIPYSDFDNFSKKCQNYDGVKNKEIWDNYIVDDTKKSFGFSKLKELSMISNDGEDILLFQNKAYFSIKEKLEKDNGLFYNRNTKRFYVKVYNGTEGETYNEHNKQEISTFLEKYSYKIVINEEEKTIPFFSTWIKDPSRKEYQDFCYETDPNYIDNGQYLNLWTGFDILRTNPCEDEDAIKKTHERVNKWFNVLTDNDLSICTYFKNWIAMLIQKPHIKSIVSLVLVSNVQGSGKSTLYSFIGAILGDRKMKKYVYLGTGFDDLFPADGFNGHLRDCFLYGADELSGDDSRKNNALFKKHSTSETITINEKCEKKLIIPNKIRLGATSNTLNPLKMGEKDRRINSTEVSDELVGNTDFWNDFYKMLDTPELCRTLYDYFYKMDIADFNDRNIPQSKLNNILTEASQEPIKRFIYDSKHHLTELSETTCFKGGDLMLTFNRWNTKNNLKEVNVTSFGLTLARDTLCKKLFIKTQPKHSVYKINVEYLNELFQDEQDEQDQQQSGPFQQCQIQEIKEKEI